MSALTLGMGLTGSGLGGVGLGFFDPTDWTTDGGDDGGDDGGGIDWNSIINTSLTTVGKIFGPKPVTPPVAVSVPGTIPAGYTLNPQGQAVPIGSQVSSGLSSAWNSLASQFGVSSGTLTLLALAFGAAIMFKPKSRR